MRAKRVASLTAYRQPGAAEWAAMAPQDIALTATPLSMQPTPYIQQSWGGKPYGQTPALKAACVHDGHEWALRVTWQGVSGMGHDFPDALAVALPVKGKPVLALMGQPDAPIHMLRWQANKEKLRIISATGIGKSIDGAAVKCGVQARAVDNEWQVVFTRVLGHGAGVAPLLAGKKTGIGFALWRGANDERAGIKAFSIDWIELALDA